MPILVSKGMITSMAYGFASKLKNYFSGFGDLRGTTFSQGDKRFTDVVSTANSFCSVGYQYYTQFTVPYYGIYGRSVDTTANGTLITRSSGAQYSSGNTLFYSLAYNYSTNRTVFVGVHQWPDAASGGSHLYTSLYGYSDNNLVGTPTLAHFPSPGGSSVTSYPKGIAVNPNTNRWVTVGTYGTTSPKWYFTTSTNGSTWSTINATSFTWDISTTHIHSGILYSSIHDKFFTVATGTSNSYILTSTDGTGTSWDSLMIDNTSYLTSIAENPNTGRIVAGGYTRTESYPCFLYCDDGVNWSSVNTVNNPDVKFRTNKMTFFDDVQFPLYFATSYDTSSLTTQTPYMFSKNGIDWISKKDAYPSLYMYGAAANCFNSPIEFFGNLTYPNVLAVGYWANNGVSINCVNALSWYY